MKASEIFATEEDCERLGVSREFVDGALDFVEKRFEPLIEQQAGFIGAMFGWGWFHREVESLHRRHEAMLEAVKDIGYLTEDPKIKRIVECLLSQEEP